jgi:hypothetical protein
MGQRDHHLTPPRRRRRTTAEPHRRRLAGNDLDVARAEAAGQPERLDDRLLGGKTGGEVAPRSRAPRGVFELAVGEEPLRQPRPARQRALDPLDLDQVDADSGHRLSLTW